MRRMLLLGIVVASLVACAAIVAAVSGAVDSAGLAGGAGRGSSVTFAGTVLQMKADAGRAVVLVAATGPGLGDNCADVFVWRPETRKLVTAFGHRHCSDGDSFQSVYGVALARNTAFWMGSTGGNVLGSFLARWSVLTGRRGKDVWAGAGGQGYSGTFLVNPNGGDDVLVYNKYAICQPADQEPDVPCPRGYAPGTLSSESIAMAQPAQRTIATSGHELTVLAVGGGRVVARLASGSIIVLAPKRAATGLVAHLGFKAEALIATYPYKLGEALAAATDGRTLAVLRKRVLDVIPLPGAPGRRATRRLPPAGSYGPDQPVACVGVGTCSTADLKLTDLDGHIAVYVYVAPLIPGTATARNAVYLLDLTTGRSVIVAHPRTYDTTAQLEPDGLYISDGNTVSFTPRSEVEQRLHR